MPDIYKISSEETFILCGSKCANKFLLFGGQLGGIASQEGFRLLIERFFKLADAWSEVFGVFGEEPTAFLEGLRDIRALRSGIDMEKVNALLAERAEARAAKDFARSDAARDALAAMGVEVRDTPSGAVWDIA